MALLVCRRLTGVAIIICHMTKLFRMAKQAHKKELFSSIYYLLVEERLAKEAIITGHVTKLLCMTKEAPGES
jgi:hypothetical protein